MKRRRSRRRNAEVVLTERSRLDIQAIDDYSTRQWGTSTADRYLSEIESAIQRLEDNRELLRLEPEFASRLYFYRVRQHIFVCDMRGSRILVLTLIHTSMDLPARLADLEPRLIVEAEMLQQKLDQRSNEA